MTSPGARGTLLVGAGDLGTAIGLRVRATGGGVLALRRRPGLLPTDFDSLAVDLTREVPDLPRPFPRVAIALTADAPDADAYRSTYVDGLRRALDSMEATGCPPARAVLISSTGVYGDLEGDIDEDTPVQPTRPTHDALLEAEEVFHARLPHGTVLRLSGLYGPGRVGFVERACAGQVIQRWTNRIHRDDAAAAVVHLLDLPEESTCPPLLLGTDEEPAPALDVADTIRRLRGLPPLPRDTLTGAHIPGRRLSSRRLRATGFRFIHPDHHSGYAAVLTGTGRRHV